MSGQWTDEQFKQAYKDLENFITLEYNVFMSRYIASLINHNVVWIVIW